MPTVRQIRHHVTKQPLIKPMLNWLQHRGLSSNDVFVASYPRSGSTWLRFILCELLTGTETSFDLVDTSVAGVGRHQKAPHLLPNSGRLLQTHEPYRSEYKRAIYLVRDVRDVIISEYLFCRRVRYFAGEFDTFFELFLHGKINRYGFWGDHASSWLGYAEKHPGQVLIIRFEDLQRDTVQIVSQCLNFLEVNHTSSQVSQAVQNHNIAHMKQKEDEAEKFKINAEGLRFVTDGAVGKGKQKMRPEQLERLTRATQSVLTQLGYLEALSPITA